MTTENSLLTPKRTDIETWAQELGQRFPHLSHPQIWGLALWSFGMIIAQACGLTSVAVSVALLLGHKPHAVKQQLREWYLEAPAKKSRGHTKGVHRQEILVTTCFAPLVRWLVARWPASEKRMALVLDATPLSNRFTILVLSVVYRGCAIPVAWKILTGNTRGAWRPHWLGLLDAIQDSIPSDWCVLVLADRGLYARWLYTAIQTHGWHPFLRINAQGQYHRWGVGDFLPLATLGQAGAATWCEQVTCFKTTPLQCTLLAHHDERYQDAWLIVTDLAPTQAHIAWYGLRAWCEAGFKDFKRGGWQWQYTRMTDPTRAERLWLALAVATLWVVAVGGAADATQSVSTLDHLPLTHIARQRRKAPTRLRMLSCFRLGVLMIVITLLAGQPFPFGSFHPEPWPEMMHDQKTYT